MTSLRGTNLESLPWLNKPSEIRQPNGILLGLRLNIYQTSARLLSLLNLVLPFSCLLVFRKSTGSTSAPSSASLCCCSISFFATACSSYHRQKKNMSFIRTVVPLSVWAAVALAAPAAEPEATPHPMVTAAPVLPRDFKPDTYVKSLIDGLGSDVSSYVASGVPQFFQDFPTGVSRIRLPPPVSVSPSSIFEDMLAEIVKL